MKSTVYILRHGETMNNRNGITQPADNNVELTTKALDELQDNMTEIVKALKGRQVYVLCSPMKRTFQTALPILSALAKENTDQHVEFDSQLHEVNFGDFGGQKEGTVIDGQSMQDFRVLTQQFYEGNVNGFKYPNGESMKSIDIRCKNIKLKMQNLMTDHAGSAVLVIGHNRFFRHLLVELGVLQPTDMFNEKIPHAKLVNVTM
jgi:broad specificity phosphatase PhoE